MWKHLDAAGTYYNASKREVYYAITFFLRLPGINAQGFYRRCTSLHLFGKESGCRPRELEADQL